MEAAFSAAATPVIDYDGERGALVFRLRRRHRRTGGHFLCGVIGFILARTETGAHMRLAAGTEDPSAAIPLRRVLLIGSGSFEKEVNLVGHHQRERHQEQKEKEERAQPRLEQMGAPNGEDQEEGNGGDAVLGEDKRAGAFSEEIGHHRIEFDRVSADQLQSQDRVRHAQDDEQEKKDEGPRAVTIQLVGKPLIFLAPDRFTAAREKIPAEKERGRLTAILSRALFEGVAAGLIEILIRHVRSKWKDALPKGKGQQVLCQRLTQAPKRQRPDTGADRSRLGRACASLRFREL